MIIWSPLFVFLHRLTLIYELFWKTSRMNSVHNKSSFMETNSALSVPFNCAPRSMVTVSYVLCCVLQLYDWRRVGPVHAATEPPAWQHGRRTRDAASEHIVRTGRCWQVRLKHLIGKQSNVQLIYENYSPQLSLYVSDWKLRHQTPAVLCEPAETMQSKPEFFLFCKTVQLLLE